MATAFVLTTYGPLNFCQCGLLFFWQRGSRKHKQQSEALMTIPSVGEDDDFKREKSIADIYESSAKRRKI